MKNCYKDWSQSREMSLTFPLQSSVVFDADNDTSVHSELASCLLGMGNVLWWDLSHHRQGSLHHWLPSHGCGVCNYTSSIIRNNLSPWDEERSLVGPVTP